jgi:uncharacterized damage-inducible protein DinB
MALKDHLLPEFDHEMGVTRRLLERVPLQDGDWKPHPQSMSLAQLANHLCDIPGWTPTLLRGSSYDMGADAGGGSPQPVKHTTSGALLAAFDQAVKSARDLLADTTDAQFMEPWTLKENGQEVFTQPKLGTIRSFFLSHMIHHRGQLSVYLRLRGVPVPAIYGPSADER